MIDLHTHTNHSDGSCTPGELLEAAHRAGLDAIAITDHDTLNGSDEALSWRLQSPVELICGIELTCKLGPSNVHLLGYFLHGDPGLSFREWLIELAAYRRERNEHLALRLRELEVDITIDEVEAVGRTMTGRPHFARVMLAKGYVSSYEDAFYRYLGEDAPAYVHREAPRIEEGIRRIREAGGVSSLAHPIRARLNGEARVFSALRDAGLTAIEAFHSDHDRSAREHYFGLAQKLGLAVSGGSDYHGEAKPSVKLGMYAIENEWLDKLREL